VTAVVDLATLATAAGTVVAGVAAWRQSRRASFTSITNRLDRELRAEREQRKLLTGYVVDLMKWARTMDPAGLGGPPPQPGRLRSQQVRPSRWSASVGWVR